MSLAMQQDDRPYSVPDFEADEDIRRRYQSVARELIAAAITRGLASVRDEYNVLRRAGAETTRRAEAEKTAAENAAHLARAKYAKIVPRQRTASGIVRPPKLFFDLMISMGAAEKYYKEAVTTQRIRREAVETARLARAALERLSGKEEAALVVRELEIRRHFKSENGRLELDADERLHGIALQCAAIEAERSDFRERTSAGTVSDEELRDRTMAQEGSRYLDGDVRGLHCLRERDVRFGKLRYFTFRDRSARIWLLDYDNDLRTLMTMTFDVIAANDRYLIARSTSSGVEQRENLNSSASSPDPRALVGVDPALLRALCDFVERERAII